jgi:hypothetical protein
MELKLNNLCIIIHSSQCVYALFASFNPTKILALECIPTHLSYMPQALKLKPPHDVITF